MIYKVGDTILIKSNIEAKITEVLDDYYIVNFDNLNLPQNLVVSEDEITINSDFIQRKRDEQINKIVDDKTG